MINRINIFKRVASLIVILTCCICSIQVMAQEVTEKIAVTGKVTDVNKEPIVGANVVIESTYIGVITDVYGNFKIEVPKNSELSISFIGYVTQRLTITEPVNLDIILESDMAELDDVVVIGYGTVKKKDLTGSIESVSGDLLVKSNNTNITETLNGNVSGVLVSKSSNRPGADMSMQIRGANSINSSNEPLYVINGVPSYSGMKHLNASDIESIDVLKDASSAAIYGSRGANGVVIITTKGANKKKGFSIDYSGSFGVKTPTRIPDMIGNKGNGLEYVDYRVALWKKKYGDASLSRTDFLTDSEKKRIRNGEYYDWLREISDQSYVTNHSISTSGGNETTSYSLGMGYLSDEGMIGKEQFTRYTANVGIEHRFNDIITTGMSSYISDNKTNHGSQDALLNAYFLPPIVSPYDDNGNYAFIIQPTSSKINPFIQNQNNIRETKAFYSNFSGFLEIKPIKGLSLKSQIAYQFDTDLYGEWIGKYTQQKGGVNPSEAYRSEGRNTNIVWDNILSYQNKFNESHRIDAIGLFNMQKDTHQGSGMRGIGLPYKSDWHAIQTADEITDVSSYYWESSMTSFMGRLNYTLLDKYMVTLTGRYDGTSRLKGDNQWGFLPAAALGWQIKNEGFMQDVEAINQLKLRLSYGKTGNNNLSHNITLTELGLSRYTFGSNGVNGFGISNVRGNENLKWEMTSEYNVGLDFGLLNNRVSGTMDAYTRETDGLIFNRAVGSLNGYSSVYQNIGKTSNKGIELTLNTVNISKNDFYWKTNLTFSLNRNKIEELYGDNQDDLGNRWFIGEPVSVIYDLKHLGIWQADEEAEATKYGQSVGHIKVEDVNGDYNLDQQDFQIIGTPSPDWMAGMINSFVYKNLDFSFDIYARVGGIYNDSFTYMFTAWDNEHWNKADVNYWTAENSSDEYQQVGAQSYHTQVLGQVSGTFVKVRNITLGYALSNSVLSKIGLKKLRLYSQVQNPFTFTDFIGSDPETIGENVNTQLSLYPMTFTFGINANF
ncbi:TonB-linked outer membrane protein, SusC/RagA family [Saccharicrinis carchari]|uniref:TonB-linked outer membrane protein, SusC/RagA family n=2 Tax=Saccharicrinis carchari TaxID=1168039 RepID=A0A521F003_SACCC|nr:TonB-linked outer membrane protein, SusC/RagA family [Saccharicrinis carchari]